MLPRRAPFWAKTLWECEAVESPLYRFFRSAEIITQYDIATFPAKQLFEGLTAVGGRQDGIRRYPAPPGSRAFDVVTERIEAHENRLRSKRKAGRLSNAKKRDPRKRRSKRKRPTRQKKSLKPENSIFQDLLDGYAKARRSSGGGS